MPIWRFGSIGIQAEDPSKAALTESKLVDGRLIRTHTSAVPIGSNLTRQHIRVRYEITP